MKRTIWLLIALLAGGAAAVGAPDAAAVDALRRSAEAAYERGDFGAAAEAFARLAEAAPNDPGAVYNLACVRARMRDVPGAMEALHGALEVGFVDFHHMDRDADIAPLRESEEYRLILLGWRELLDARGEADLESAREALGRGYLYESEEALRLNIASAFDRKSTDEALEEVRRTAEWAERSLFGAMMQAPEDRPDHWVTLALPTPEHFKGFVPVPGVGGIYDRDRRLLVSQDLGPSLRHEFLHVLHHRIMDRMGQAHPIWIQEGLGAIVEDLEEVSGVWTPVASWRTNIVKRLEARGRLVPWKVLFEMPRDRFVKNRPNANYAQARAVVLFLAERGKLGSWWEAYVETFAEDAGGGAAIERVFGRPLAQVEREYREWLVALPEVAEEIRPGMPSLGVVIDPGSGDGPVVVEVVARGGLLGGDRLRRGDVVTSVAGRVTRTPEDLVRVLSEQDVGDSVEVTVRRGTLRLPLRITLVPLEREALGP